MPQEARTDRGGWLLAGLPRGLYNDGYRWYAPNLRRWIRRDPIGEEGGMNLYSALQNSPVMRLDASGLADTDNCLRQKARKALHYTKKVDELWKKWARENVCALRRPSCRIGVSTVGNAFVTAAMDLAEAAPGLTAIAAWERWNAACQGCRGQFYSDDERGRCQERTCDFICAVKVAMSERMWNVAPKS